MVLRGPRAAELPLARGSAEASGSEGDPERGAAGFVGALGPRAS